MGGLVSTHKVNTTMSSIFDEKSFVACPRSVIKQDQKVGDIVVGEGCSATLNLTQLTVLDDTCAVDQLTKNAVDYYVKNRQDIEEGLSPNILNITNVSSDTKFEEEVKNAITTICPEKDVKQSQIIGNVFCQGGDLNLTILQSISGRTACIANQVLEQTNKWKEEYDDKTNISSGLADIFKTFVTLPMIIGGIIVILIVLFILFKVL